MLLGNRYRVKTVITPRVTSTEPLDSQPATTNCTVAFYRFERIRRTRRHIPTRRRAPISDRLIDTNQSAEEARAQRH